MGSIKAAHEWTANRFRFVQYPRERRPVRSAGERDWIDTAFRLGLFIVGIWWIWGTFLLIAVCLLVALLAE